MARPSVHGSRPAAPAGTSPGPSAGPGTTGSAVGPDPSGPTVDTSINQSPGTLPAVGIGDLTTTDLRAGTEGLELSEVPERAQAPIRWPRPAQGTVALVALWLGGLALALALPATIVPPDERDPANSAVGIAFALTVLGAVVMLVAAAGIFRRNREPIVLVMGAVPAFSVILGGCIIAMTKIFDSSGYGR